MFKYLDHQADIVIFAENKSWPKVFIDGAKAVFNLMYNIDLKYKKFPLEACLRRQANQPLAEKIKDIKIEVTAESIEGLFVEWLNELLAQKDLNHLNFFDFGVDKIEQIKGQWKLVGRAKGINPADYHGELKTEVKAATYGSLRCSHKKNIYFCQCIVDI